MNLQPLFRHTLLAAAIISASCLSTVQAQESVQEEQQLDSMTVYGSTYRNTATKTQLSPEETPQGISVIDEPALEARDADSVAEALRYTPGVNTELRGGAVNRLDLFNIRGFINYQNFYDGLPLPYNDWNLQTQVDMQAVQQVEVFKGPTSSLYGAMPPGGMVNLISKKPLPSAYNSLELSVGSNKLKEITFDSAGQLGSSDLTYRFNGLANSSDGQAETSENERLMLAPSVDWQMTDDTLINLNAYYQKDPDMGIYTTLPAQGLFQDNINGRLDEDAYSGDADWNTYEREVLMLGYKIDHQISDNWSFLQNFRYQHGDAYQENTYTTELAADQRTLSRRAYLTDETTAGFAMDNQLSGVVMTGVVEHNLLLGVDYTKMESDIGYEDATAPAIDIYNPDHHQIVGSALDFSASGYSSQFRIEKEQVGVYFQDQLRMGQWVLIAGGRYDSFESRENGVQYGAKVDSKVDQNNTSWRAGALYEFSNGLSPFISYAESFEPVGGLDRLGSTYEPSTANQWETGIKYSSPNKQTTASIALYRIEKENVLTRDPNGTPYDQVQAGEVRSQGVEIEARSQINRSLNLMASYNYQNVEVTKDNSGLQGKTPVWVPDQSFNTWASYDIFNGPLSGLTLGGGVRYIGKAELDALNSDTVPSATLVDASIGYDLSELGSGMDGASVKLTANNLFDERYYSCYDGLNCWFGAERSVQASVRYDF
ncbi:TonB-dependent siderophore receptor [Halopseudomonas sp.]|uniref:TonB-dependent siderophore receptor n=1 Tax=Halopseudomonas sp. TaxID=2901191 RepID=UPI00300272E0